MNHYLFYCCYLIRSLHPQHKNKVYIGSTPDPLKRIRQHNGNISQGAFKTAKGRPWELVLFVYGFPSKRSALQFEWAWQHPTRSRHTKRQKLYVDPTHATGIRQPAQANLYLSKLRVLYDLLCTKPFCDWPLKIRFMSAAEQAMFMAEAASPNRALVLPSQLFLSHGPTEEMLPILKPIKRLKNDDDPLIKWFQQLPNSFNCYLCQSSMEKMGLQRPDRYICCSGNYTNACTMVSHLTCLAALFLSDDLSQALIPTEHSCPVCFQRLIWGDMISDLRLREVLQKREIGKRDDDNDDEVDTDTDVTGNTDDDDNDVGDNKSSNNDSGNDSGNDRLDAVQL